MPNSITIEPLSHYLRQESGRETDPNHLAVVHSQGLGALIAIVDTTDDVTEAYRIAHEFAPTVGAEVLIGSSYRPTVVGKDVAAMVIADPHNQPTGCDTCANGCYCMPGTAGCGHWGCWASHVDATCPLVKPYRDALYAKYPRLARL